MSHYVGLDVSLKEVSVCVLDDDGCVVWRGSCPSTPESIAATVRQHAPEVLRLGLETGSLSPWLARGLENMGLPVVCLDARQAKAVLSLRINKSDPNDAHGLAEIVRSGWYREVQVKSQSAYQLQGLVGARAQPGEDQDRSWQSDPRLAADLRLVSWSSQWQEIRSACSRAARG